jgi:hypothetical protein
MSEIFSQNLIFTITGLIIGIIGIIIQQTKAYFLIAGYNTMSPEKRKKINIEQAAITFRNALILLGLVWIIVPLSFDLLGFPGIKYWFLIGLHILIVSHLIRKINTQSKYKIP